MEGNAMIEIKQDGNKLLCTFKGFMDTSNSGRVEPQLRQALDGYKGSIVFDLQEVDYVASAFIRLCVAAHRAAGAEGFTIVNSKPPVKKVFMISGLQGMLG